MPTGGFGSSNWGSGYNNRGQQRAPQGTSTQGSIFRGQAPAQSRYQPPRAGVAQNFNGGRPVMRLNTQGDWLNPINQLAKPFAWKPEPTEVKLAGFGSSGAPSGTSGSDGSGDPFGGELGGTGGYKPSADIFSPSYSRSYDPFADEDPAKSETEISDFLTGKGMDRTAKRMKRLETGDMSMREAAGGLTGLGVGLAKDAALDFGGKVVGRAKDAVTEKFGRRRGASRDSFSSPQPPAPGLLDDPFA